MGTISLEVNEDTLAKMHKFYHDNLITSSNQYVLFSAKTLNCTITAYKSKKVLFQGKAADTEAQIWKTNELDDAFYLESIGSDEVGTGDYFGPVVVCSVYLSKEKVSIIKNYQVNDSKQLTDTYIRQLAPLLYKQLPYSLLVVTNEKYNDMMNNKNMNLNKMKALLHKQAISNLTNKYQNKQVIIDQFCSIANFNKYTNDNTFSKKVTFSTKAEAKYASVALASIMARYKFLLEMDKLSKIYHLNLLKGASNKVDLQAKELVKRYGKEVLTKIAKLHFKNTSRI